MRAPAYDPLTTTVWVARTLPVMTEDDLAPYHWVRNERGNLSLRKGAPPKAVVEAASDFADGRVSLDGFLDRIGVPKS